MELIDDMNQSNLNAHDGVLHHKRKNMAQAMYNNLLHKIRFTMHYNSTAALENEEVTSIKNENYGFVTFDMEISKVFT